MLPRVTILMPVYNRERRGFAPALFIRVIGYALRHGIVEPPK